MFAVSHEKVLIFKAFRPHNRISVIAVHEGNPALKVPLLFGKLNIIDHLMAQKIPDFFLAALDIQQRMSIICYTFHTYQERRNDDETTARKVRLDCGEKGQIVIPKQAREVFGIEPGDVLLLLGDEKRGIAIPPKEQMEKMHFMTFGGPEK